MVTHEDDVAAHAKRIVRLRDGLLQSDKTNEQRVSALKRTHAPGVAMPQSEAPVEDQMVAEVA
jgi:hypothetical protein